MKLQHTPASCTWHAASLTVLLCVCLSAGPDVNPALVQQQEEEEAAAAKETSCSKHSAPMSTDDGVYVNYSFEHPDKSAGGLASSPSENRQKF